MKNKIKLWHPSDIWEWYRRGDRHHDRGKGFISFPDYRTKTDENTELKSLCLSLWSKLGEARKKYEFDKFGAFENYIGNLMDEDFERVKKLSSQE